MATVHGTFLLTDCGKPPTGGCVCFCDLPDCVTYCAELVYAGEHAGMIALTITNANKESCNDTFYSCMDFATHKWQVEIPDDCCGVTIPTNIWATFKDVTNCPPWGGAAECLNGSHLLPAQGYYAWGATLDCDASGDCGDRGGSNTMPHVDVAVYRIGDIVYIISWDFYAHAPVESGFMEVSNVPNEYTDCYECPNALDFPLTGGTVSITEEE